MSEDSKETIASGEFLKAVIDAPYSFNIRVEDNSDLPASLKSEELIGFSLSSPTLGVLSKVALLLSIIPDEDIKILEGEALQKRLSLISKHSETLVDMLCALLWGKKEDPPAWWKGFFMSNLTKKEILELFCEAMARVDTSFFLPSLKIARLMSNGVAPALTL